MVKARKGKPSPEEIESDVYRYILKHDGEIDPKECAKELTLTTRVVEKAIESLVEEGKLEAIPRTTPPKIEELERRLKKLETKFEEREKIEWLKKKPRQTKCIIATCALPSQHPDLNYLRHFRDEVLKPTKLGRLIVWIYYAVSPPIALMVCASKRMKRLVRKRFIPFWIRICKEWEEQKKDTKG